MWVKPEENDIPFHLCSCYRIYRICFHKILKCLPVCIFFGYNFQVPFRCKCILYILYYLRRSESFNCDLQVCWEMYIFFFNEIKWRIRNILFDPYISKSMFFQSKFYVINSFLLFVVVVQITICFWKHVNAL